MITTRAHLSRSGLVQRSYVARLNKPPTQRHHGTDSHTSNRPPCAYHSHVRQPLTGPSAQFSVISYQFRVRKAKSSMNSKPERWRRLAITRIGYQLRHVAERCRGGLDKQHDALKPPWQPVGTFVRTSAGFVGMAGVLSLQLSKGTSWSSPSSNPI